jgi:hypothetical protein
VTWSQLSRCGLRGATLRQVRVARLENKPDPHHHTQDPGVACLVSDPAGGIDVTCNPGLHVCLGRCETEGVGGVVRLTLASSLERREMNDELLLRPELPVAAAWIPK